MARECFEEGCFFEVFVATSLAVCAERDPKGLYSLAKAGKITHLTGWDAPYEPPENPEFIIQTTDCPVDKSADPLVRHALAKAQQFSATGGI